MLKTRNTNNYRVCFRLNRSYNISQAKVPLTLTLSLSLSLSLFKLRNFKSNFIALNLNHGNFKDLDLGDHSNHITLHLSRPCCLCLIVSLNTVVSAPPIRYEFLTHRLSLSLCNYFAFLIWLLRIPFYFSFYHFLDNQIEFLTQWIYVFFFFLWFSFWFKSLLCKSLQRSLSSNWFCFA